MDDFDFDSLPLRRDSRAPQSSPLKDKLAVLSRGDCSLAEFMQTLLQSKATFLLNEMTEPDAQGLAPEMRPLLLNKGATNKYISVFTDQEMTRVVTDVFPDYQYTIEVDFAWFFNAFRVPFGYVVNPMSEPFLEIEPEQVNELRAEMQKPVSAGGTPQVIAPDTPVTNPEVVTALAHVAAEGSGAAKDRLLAAIARGQYLVPVHQENAPIIANDKAALQKGDLLRVCLLENAQGQPVTPLFTDWEALRARIEQPLNALIMPAMQAWSFVLGQPDCAAGVLFSVEHDMPLPQELLAILLEQGGGAR